MHFLPWVPGEYFAWSSSVLPFVEQLLCAVHSHCRWTGFLRKKRWEDFTKRANCVFKGDTSIPVCFTYETQNEEFLLWCSGLISIRCCACGVGCTWSSDSISGPVTSVHHDAAPRKGGKWDFNNVRIFRICNNLELMKLNIWINLQGDWVEGWDRAEMESWFCFHRLKCWSWVFSRFLMKDSRHT